MSSSPSQLSRMYASIVEEHLGVIATVDAQDDVVFKYPELGTVVISVLAERDPEVMQLVFPHFLAPAEVGLDEARFLDAINRVNAQAKGAKVYLNPARGRASASVESVLAASDEAPERELVAAVIERMMSMLGHAARLLLKTCSEDANSARDSKMALN